MRGPGIGLNDSGSWKKIAKRAVAYANPSDRIVTCPKCGRTYWAGNTIDNPPGRQRYCQGCGTVFVADAITPLRLPS